MNTNYTNEILFITTFLSKLAFAVLFGVGTFLIYGHRGEDGDVRSVDLVLSCGGDESYFALDTSTCYYYGEDSRCEYWYDYKGMNITEPWDEKVVQCMYNVRGGLFTTATIFFVLSIILEDPRVKTTNNRKVYLLMKMLRAVGGLFLLGSVASEMDIMKRLLGASAFYTYVDYARFFVLKYPDISNILWIIGTLITMICEVYLGYHHMHNSSVLATLTYIMAAIGSFFLFVAGTIRNHTVAEKLFPNYDYATFYINAKIFPLMLTGTVLFFVHSLMFYVSSLNH